MAPPKTVSVLKKGDIAWVPWKRIYWPGFIQNVYPKKVTYTFIPNTDNQSLFSCQPKMVFSLHTGDSIPDDSEEPLKRAFQVAQEILALQGVHQNCDAPKIPAEKIQTSKKKMQGVKRKRTEELEQGEQEEEEEEFDPMSPIDVAGKVFKELSKSGKLDKVKNPPRNGLIIRIPPKGDLTDIQIDFVVENLVMRSKQRDPNMGYLFHVNRAITIVLPAVVEQLARNYEQLQLGKLNKRKIVDKKVEVESETIKKSGEEDDKIGMEEEAEEDDDEVSVPSSSRRPLDTLVSIACKERESLST